MTAAGLRRCHHGGARARSLPGCRLRTLVRRRARRSALRPRLRRDEAPGYMLTLSTAAPTRWSRPAAWPTVAHALKAEARRRVAAGAFFGHIAFASLIARRPAHPGPDAHLGPSTPGRRCVTDAVNVRACAPTRACRARRRRPRRGPGRARQRPASSTRRSCARSPRRPTPPARATSTSTTATRASAARSWPRAPTRARLDAAVDGRSG